MLIHRTGGRHDGRNWPEYLDIIDVPQWEADQLIAEGHAELPDAPVRNRGYSVLKAPDPDYEAHLKRADGEDQTEEDIRYAHHADPKEREDLDNDDFDNDFDGNDSDNDVTTEVNRPYTNATKAEWVKYAVYLGSDEQEAKSMTKNALIEEYGN